MLQGFVLGPGRVAQPGDVLDIDVQTVRKEGVVLTGGSGAFIKASLYERVEEAPVQRDPEPKERDPRPRRRRSREGEQG